MDTLQHERLAESPVYFDANDETLFGILTTPKGPSSKTAAIVLTGRGFPSPNRNRFSVHLCRTLIDFGVTGLRFDYHGVGESTGVADDFDLSKPFVDDLEGAIRYLKGQGFGSFVLIGSCFGARTALALAPKVPELAGLVLLAAPLHEDAGAALAFRLSSRDYVRRAMRGRTLRKLFQAEHRKRYLSAMRSKLALSRSTSRGASSTTRKSSALTDTFSSSLEAILARKIPVLFVYGTHDRYYRQFERARQLALGNLLKRAGQLVRVTKLEGKVHGFTNVDTQSEVIEAVTAWFRERLGDQADHALGEKL